MRIIFGFLILLLILASLNSSGNAQLESKALQVKEAQTSVNCAQPAAEQEALIREAEKGRFILRRMELVGNVSTADEALHRRIVIRMAEGNLFSRRNLIASLKNVSRLKTIYPVTMKDVVARLDKTEKTLDLRICIKERPQRVNLSGRGDR
jgi:outer membrane protein assembly factor BamA